MNCGECLSSFLWLVMESFRLSLTSRFLISHRSINLTAEKAVEESRHTPRLSNNNPSKWWHTRKSLINNLRWIHKSSFINHRVRVKSLLINNTRHIIQTPTILSIRRAIKRWKTRSKTTTSCSTCSIKPKLSAHSQCISNSLTTMTLSWCRSKC